MIVEEDGIRKPVGISEAAGERAQELIESPDWDGTLDGECESLRDLLAVERS